MYFRGFLSLVFFLCVLGCKHDLEIKNLDDYAAPKYGESANRDLVLQINGLSREKPAELLCAEIGKSLSENFGYEVVGRGVSARDKSDVSVSIDVKAVGDASWTNFLISWPGCIIFLPPWIGYSYDATFAIKCSMVASVTGAEIGTFTQMVNLHMRFADEGSTIGPNLWLVLYTVPGLVNAFSVTSFDNDIWDRLSDKGYATIGELVAVQVAQAICKVKWERPTGLSY